MKTPYLRDSPTSVVPLSSMPTTAREHSASAPSSTVAPPGTTAPSVGTNCGCTATITGSGPIRPGDSDSLIVTAADGLAANIDPGRRGPHSVCTSNPTYFVSGAGYNSVPLIAYVPGRMSGASCAATHGDCPLVVVFHARPSPEGVAASCSIGVTSYEDFYWVQLFLDDENYNDYARFRA